MRGIPPPNDPNPSTIFRVSQEPPLAHGVAVAGYVHADGRPLHQTGVLSRRATKAVTLKGAKDVSSGPGTFLGHL